jgi:probable HAF family extracellular repeat protein
LNNKGQVVGHTCDSTDTYCSAYLWQNGVMTDLNTLIPPGSSLFLAYASDINDRGEIVGEAIDQTTNEYPAFLAIPCDEEHANVAGCQATSQVSVHVERPRVALPENVREQLQRMPFGRFRGQLGEAR